MAAIVDAFARLGHAAVAHRVGARAAELFRALGQRDRAATLDARYADA
ncbi:MAG: hypothetical protein R3F65_30865 [bacterium]